MHTHTRRIYLAGLQRRGSIYKWSDHRATQRRTRNGRSIGKWTSDIPACRVLSNYIQHNNGRPLIGGLLATMADNIAAVQIAVFRASGCVSRTWPIVRSLLTVLIVILLKAAVSLYVFRCPCKEPADVPFYFKDLPFNTVYSALFFGVPAFLLWLYGWY